MISCTECSSPSTTPCADCDTPTCERCVSSRGLCKQCLVDGWIIDGPRPWVDDEDELHPQCPPVNVFAEVDSRRVGGS